MNKPVKLLEGKKVYLRPYEPEDNEYLYHSVFSAEGRRLTGTQQVFTRAVTADFIARVGGDKSRLDLVICSQETDEPLGEVVLNNIDYVNRNANIRIGIFEDKNFSRGYGSEALILMLNHAFGALNLHRIELGVFAFNARAIHVYEKLGFKHEGVMRDYLYFNYEYHDQILMSILADEFWQLHCSK
jgi:RimJ/RimL family protein N-acetyltransferase